MLADGIENEAYNWDTLVLKVLSLLLQCMTGGRAGELHRAYLYQEEEALRWKDVTIQLVHRHGRGELLAASINTTFRKGHL